MLVLLLNLEETATAVVAEFSCYTVVVLVWWCVLDWTLVHKEEEQKTVDEEATSTGDNIPIFCEELAFPRFQ